MMKQPFRAAAEPGNACSGRTVADVARQRENPSAEGTGVRAEPGFAGAGTVETRSAGSKAEARKPGTDNFALRLRKHSDYQRVYTSSRKQFSKQMSFFYSIRPAHGPDGKVRRCNTVGPRVGLTVGKVIGKAVDRNRIKRRMRECIRRQATLLTAPVDVILHPRRDVIGLEFARLEREVAKVFRGIQAAIDKAAGAAGKSAALIEAAVADPAAAAKGSAGAGMVHAPASGSR